MKRRHLTSIGVLAAVVFSALLIFAEPADAGVRFSISAGGRIGSHHGRSYHRSGHRGHGHVRYHHRPRSYVRHYRPYSCYRGPVVTRSYVNYYSYPSSTTYYSSYSPYYSSSSYYTPSTTTYYRSSGGGCGSTTVVKYIVVR